MNGGGSLVIGLLGCGVVGGGVAYRVLHQLSTGPRRLQLGSVLVRDIDKPRTPPGVRPFLTTSGQRVLEDPAVDVIVECLGGIEPARRYVEAALRRNLPVITANKTLVAEHGTHLERVAQECGTRLAFEAAIGGAAPIVRTLRHLVRVDEVLEISGVTNGTTNAVLSAMEEGTPYDQALIAAQHAGYTERDASADLDGIDAAQKLSILTGIAFGVHVAWQSIERTGIRALTPDDAARARRRGARIKLVARARRCGSDVFAWIGPEHIAIGHPLAATTGAENAFVIFARHAGPIVVGGLGAGRSPTAAAIFSDFDDLINAQKETSHA